MNRHYNSYAVRHMGQPDSTSTDGTVWFYDSNGGQIEISTRFLYILGTPSLATLERANVWLEKKGYSGRLSLDCGYIVITTDADKDGSVYDHINTAYEYR